MKKEWIIWIVIALLAIALIIGVVILSNANKTPPVQDSPATTEGTTAGETGDTPQTDGTTAPEETTQPSDSEETTGVEETTQPQQGSTQPEETTGTSGDTTTSTTKPQQNSGGNGFGERDPVTPTTKPEQETTKPPMNETTPPTTTPGETNPTTKEEMTYQSYLKMTTEEQIAFQNTFSSRNAFKQWYLAAKEAYEADQKKVTIGNGTSIDLGELIGTEP